MQNTTLHVGIIMDGNGRWALRRGLRRTAGHREGARSVRAVVEAAADPARGIGWLTLYAFSSDNWRRPGGEVGGLMRLFGEYLRREVETCVENGVRLEVVGRRDRLPSGLVSRIEAAESATAAGEELTLRLAIDYSARDVIVRAAELARRLAGGRDGNPGCDGGDGSDRDGGPGREPGASAGHAPLDRDAFRRLLAEAQGAPEPAPDVDLLIRTGGERRLSDFLLWECAYAELCFPPVLWPDFGAAELDRALAEYRRRDRRFGQVLEEAV
jgi:undecaprenyl diphosphate synthase